MNVNYALHLLIYFAIYAIVALSLNFVVGYCGLLTLAHAAYFAVGCYAYAIATIQLGWGFLPAAALGISVAMLLSLAVSLPAWRFKGDFFVLMSLAVQVVLFSIIYNWTSEGAEVGTLANLTNGPYGIAGIPKPAIFGTKLHGKAEIAGLAIALAVACALITWLLNSSQWGRLLKSIRDDELAVRGLGKNVQLAKVQVFAISCGMVALAGAIYASYVNYIEPGSASLDHSILMLSMVLIGGAGNFRGPLVGAIVLIAIPEVLRFIHIPDAAAANIRLMLYGAILVLMMHFRPQGIAGEYRMD